MTSQLRTQTYRSFDLVDNSPSEHDAEEEAYVRIRRFGKTLIATLLKRCTRVLPADWRILLWSRETDEAIIASYGSVQIRHVPGGCFVQTCVKGDMNLARGTALLRLVKYVSGDNQRAARLDAERPLLQQRKAPGLWQIAVRLTAVDDVQAAPVPRARKLRIVAQAPITWAVVARRGRPTEQAIERAERAIINTLTRSPWLVTGPATVRIHVPTSVLPFAGSFEVAVPVFSHTRDASAGECCQSLDVRRSPTNRPANPPSPSVH